MKAIRNTPPVYCFDHGAFLEECDLGTVNQSAGETGATAIEYGLIAAGIAIAIIAAVGLLGDSLNAMFAEVETGLQ